MRKCFLSRTISGGILYSEGTSLLAGNADRFLGCYSVEELLALRLLFHRRGDKEICVFCFLLSVVREELNLRVSERQSAEENSRLRER